MNFRPPRGLLGILCLLPALLMGSGCRVSGSDKTPPATDTASAFFSIAVDEARSSSASRPGRVSSLAFSAADITRIRVSVKEVSTGTLIYDNFELTKTDTTWAGTLPFLPRGKPVTFLAKALNASNELLFSGSTDQTLMADKQTVTIVLAPANDGLPITLPRITRITIPAAFPEGKHANISFSVSANHQEKLTYAINPASGGGTFLPQRGFITLVAAAGTFVSQYTPPNVSEEAEFTHEITVTNAAGHSVTTTFKTRVLPAGGHDDVLEPRIEVRFNPVINAIAAHRLVGTNDVLWKATVADDAPLAELAYKWSFTADGTFEPAPSLTDAESNPTRMLNYTPLLQGTLTLAVTDARGGKTTLTYVLTPGQFPDDFHEEGDLGGLQSISGGGYHTCALLDGAVRCWGYNRYGQLGYGHMESIGDNERPSQAGNVNLVGTAIQVVTGALHTCALLDSGFVRCWGYNGHGQLGHGTTENVGDNEPVASQGYVNLGGRATKLAAGGYHTCAVLDTGTVRCWGRNNHGELGYGHTHQVGDNEAVWTAGDVEVGGLVKDLVAGGRHTCALLTTGNVRCWGYNADGQLGIGHTTWIGDDESPSTAAEIEMGGAVKQLTASNYHTCALLETGKVRCWGYNGYGQLGYPSNVNVGDNETPASAGDVNVGDTVLQIAASRTEEHRWGYAHTCALLSTGSVKCWGYNNEGQLGYANTTSLSEPPAATVNLGGTSAYAISAGGNHTCALMITGKARCWGHNANGELGYGHTHHVGDNEPPFVAGEIEVVAP
ncbi:RCC1 domain-containing protein [Archangium gephyra]|uniref:RCC1 domain-containing protein n=1 Tax=Archangium gephyra TaxID=48 RepID=UPI003B7C0D4F